MVSSVNLNNLETFFLLAETGSFSSTAKRLRVSQSAASKQIRSLESELRCELFLRNKNEVILSPQGRALWLSLKPFYEELYLRIDNFITQKNELKGRIVFACYQEIGERVFIHVMNEFKRSHPDLLVDVRFLSSAEIVDGIKKGEIDVGVLASPQIKESIRSYAIYDESFVLVTTPVNAHKKISEIIKSEFVSYKESDLQLMKYFKKVYPKHSTAGLNIGFMASSHRAMIESVKRQNYFAVLPELSVRAEVENGELVISGQGRLSAKLYLAHLDLSYKIPKVETLKTFIMDQLKKMA